MAKVRTPRKTESAARRAKRISSQILNKDEMDGLIEFVRNEYEKQLDSAHAASFYKRNRLRDIAIVSLFPGSCIRLNELVGLQTSDIDSIKDDINVVRVRLSYPLRR